MIVSFSVTNYRIFHEKTTISMEASKDKRLPDNKFSCDGYKNDLLKLSAMYGANASGKTTMFQALNLFVNFIRVSASHTQDLRLNYAPFAFCDTVDPTALECNLITKGVRYQYGFAYNSDRIIKEYLYSYPKGRKTIIFERIHDEFTFKSDARFRKENARRVGSKSLYVSVCSQFNDEDCMNIFEWASKEVLVLVNYDVSYSLDVFTSLMKSDEKFREYALKAFDIVDLGITNVQDKGKELLPANAGTVVLPIQDIWVKHTYGSISKEFPISMESAGTVRFLSVIGPIIQALMNGTTLVIDELDISFHPDLCMWAVSLFLDPSENQRNAQLILNTHDVSLLDQSVIRRDQIYLSIKDWNTGEGHIRRLSDYNIRNDLDIRKAYLNGSFGGKPFISPDKLMGNEE